MYEATCRACHVETPGEPWCSSCHDFIVRIAELGVARAHGEITNAEQIRRDRALTHHWAGTLRGCGLETEAVTVLEACLERIEARIVELEAVAAEWAE